MIWNSMVWYTVVRYRATRTLSPESAAGSEAPNPNKRIINDYCLVPTVGRPTGLK